ncbi:MAG: hypothetical protein V4549_03585 [Bacteroidota bacterium]
MMYIIVTKNSKVVVTEKEKEDFLLRYQNSQSGLLRLKGQYVDRMGIEIYELPFFIKQEEDKLKLRGLRRCKHCAEIINRMDKCGCVDDHSKREQENIFNMGNLSNKLIS